MARLGWRWSVTLVAPAALASCSSGADVGLRDVDRTDVPPATTAAPLSAAAVLEELAPSLVFVETPIATGSGVVVEDGWVITNAHVVDPFGRATVTPVGGRPEELDVVGTDLFADLAVLGPLSQDAPARSLDAPDPPTGSDVFLVGFPGDVSGEPEPTIARGILSRRRTLEDFGLTYLQTDAAIGEGQSGGAMVDDQGRLLGISGLSYAEEFALALSTEDVATSMADILEGAAVSYVPLPDEPLVSETTFTLPYRYDAQVLVWPAGPQPRTITLTVPTDLEVTLEVSDLFGDRYLINAAAIDEELAYDPTLTPADLGDAAEAVAPGQWEFDLPADTVGFAWVGARTEGATVTVTGSEPFVAMDDPDQDRPLEPGESVTGVIDALEPSDAYLIELDAGDTIDVNVDSPVADTWFSVVPPGSWLGAAEYVDDSGGGLYGLAAHDTYRADVAGTHRLVVGSNEYFLALAYELTVTPA